MEAASQQSAEAIRLRNLSCQQGGSRLFTIRDWALPQGAHGLMTGPSGSGKTTLLHCIAGLEPEFDGELRVIGQELKQLSRGARDRFRAAHIGLIFQDFHLLEGLTVEDNLRLGSWLAGRTASRQAAHHWLERLGLGDKAHRYPHELSQGEKQRIAIGRALIHEPQLILADEPTSALDDGNAHTVLALLLSEADRQGASVLVASHDNRIRRDFGYCLALDEQADELGTEQ